jgi:hypothetical protein
MRIVDEKSGPAARKLRRAVCEAMVSNYTITDGGVSVVLRSPFEVLARGARSKEWWSILLDYRSAILEAHATSGRVRPAQRVKSQWLAGDV